MDKVKELKYNEIETNEEEIKQLQGKMKNT